MEDKKTNVSTVLLVIAIIVIIIQAIYNYQFWAEKKIAEERVESLTNQISNLEGNVGTYRKSLDEIAAIVNEALYPSETVEAEESGEEVVPAEEIIDSGEEPTEPSSIVEEDIISAPVAENSEVI